MNISAERLPETMTLSEENLSSPEALIEGIKQCQHPRGVCTAPCDSGEIIKLVKQSEAQLAEIEQRHGTETKPSACQKSKLAKTSEVRCCDGERVVVYLLEYEFAGRGVEPEKVEAMRYISTYRPVSAPDLVGASREQVAMLRQ